MLRPMVAMAKPMPDARVASATPRPTTPAREANVGSSGPSGAPWRARAGHMASATRASTTKANTVMAASTASALAMNTRPRRVSQVSDVRHAPRRELGAHERRAERPADQRQPRAHPLEDLPEITPVEPRIVDVADRLLGKHASAISSEISSSRSTPCSRRHASICASCGFGALFGLGDPLLVGLLGE